MVCIECYKLLKDKKCPQCRREHKYIDDVKLEIFFSYTQMEKEILNEKIKKIINYKLVKLINIINISFCSKNKYIELAEKAEAYMKISKLYKNINKEKEIEYLEKSLAIKEEDEYDDACIRLINLYFNDNQKEKVINILMNNAITISSLIGNDDILLFVSTWYFDNNYYDDAFIAFNYTHTYTIYRTNCHKYLAYMHIHGKGTEVNFEKGWEFYGYYLKENNQNKKVKNIQNQLLNIVEKTLKLK